MKFRLALILIILGISMLSAETTVQFQNGVKPLADYMKCVDTFIPMQHPAECFGHYRHLSVAGQGAPSYVLIKFDVAEYVPADAQITKAVLHMYPKLYTGVHKKLKWYGVGADWKENQASWTVASAGEAWSREGGDPEFTIQSAEITAEKSVHTWDVTSIVSKWVRTAHQNHGIMLVPGDETADFECWYYSSETDRSEMRPRLSVTYMTQAEIDKAAAKKTEELKKIKEAQKKKIFAEKAAKKEEKLTSTPRPEEPWVVSELKVFPYKKYTDVPEMPFWLKKHNNRNGTARLRADDTDPGAMAGKYGQLHYVYNVGRAEGVSKRLEVRIRGGVSVYVDVNNDGKYDDRKEKFRMVKGIAGPIHVTGVFSTRESKKVRFDYDFFVYARDKQKTSFGIRHAAFLRGVFNNRPIMVYDANDNCKFNDYGIDRIIIGKEDLFLNRYLEDGGQWYRVDVAPTGEFIAFAPAGTAGDTGVVPATVRVMKGFDGGRYRFEPDYVLLRKIDRNEECTYRVDAKQPNITIPAGQYKLFYAELSARQKKEVFFVDGNKMPAVVLAAGQAPYVLKWGLPLAIQFAAARTGDSYTIGNAGIKICGTEGAEYTLKSGKKIFHSPPRVEFYHGKRIEIKRNMRSDPDDNTVYQDLTVKVKTKDKYHIKMFAKSALLGELKGETIK